MLEKILAALEKAALDSDNEDEQELFYLAESLIRRSFNETDCSLS